MPDITALTADMRALGGQRVWSLMVSLFGDLAQGEGDGIDGPVLSVIMAALEVKPEATRVALHRLRNDGWLASVKSGRISRHSLTDQGRSESAAASPRIYAQPDDGPQDWQLVVLQSADTDAQEMLSSEGFQQLLPRVFIGQTSVPTPQSALVMTGGSAPGWLVDQLLPEQVVREYAKLHQSLIALSRDLPNPSQLTALETAVLRCLTVHNWRRLVLKHPKLPGALIEETNPIHLCHIAVADLLARYPRPALAHIAQDQAAA